MLPARTASVDEGGPAYDEGRLANRGEGDGLGGCEAVAVDSRLLSGKSADRT